MRDKRKQSGVTLIELLIVMVIVAIIATFAIPALRSNIAMAQVTSAIPLSETLRQKVAQHWAFQGAMPAGRADLNLGPATDTANEYVLSLEVNDGALIAQMRADANALVANQTLVLLPVTDNDGNLSWICSPAPAPAGMTIQTAALVSTTVGAEYVPSSCE